MRQKGDGTCQHELRAKRRRLERSEPFLRAEYHYDDVVIFSSINICVLLLCVFAAFLLLLLLLLHSFCVSVLWWKCSFLGASGVCSDNLFVKTAHAQPLQIFSPEFLLAFVITSSEEEE